MAEYTGWTETEIRLALERANAHFKGNLRLSGLAFIKRMKRSGEPRYSACLVTRGARRLTMCDLRTNYPETLRNFEERRELLPDFLYPAGSTVSFHCPGVAPKGVAWGCWHAHGQFYRELFRINPDGHIKTSIARYNGVKGFEYEFPHTGDMRKGHQCMADRCSCDEHDIGDEWQ